MHVSKLFVPQAKATLNTYSLLVYNFFMMIMHDLYFKF